MCTMHSFSRTDISNKLRLRYEQYIVHLSHKLKTLNSRTSSSASPLHCLSACSAMALAPMAGRPKMSTQVTITTESNEAWV